MPNVLVLLGHPNLDSFTAGLAQAYAESARECSATVSRLDLTQLAFDPVLRHGFKSEQPLEPDLAAARDAVVAADHLAWFFPMWWGGPPALVKGFVERVFTPGFAFRYRGRNQLPHKLLAGRSARLVTSMDSPGFWYNLALRRPLHASFCVATLSFVGIAPVRTTTLYELRFRSANWRSATLDRVRRAAAKDVCSLERRRPRRLARLGALERAKLLTEKVPDCSHARNAP